MKSPNETNKEKYHSHISKKLINPLTSTKTYWSLSKSFLNNENIPCISAMLHRNRCNTKYKYQAELFNNNFPNQSSPINNSRLLPLVLFRIGENVITSITFSWNDIAKIIQKLDPYKFTIWSVSRWLKYVELYLQTTSVNFTVSCWKWEVPIRMEKTYIVPVY